MPLPLLAEMHSPVFYVMMVPVAGMLLALVLITVGAHFRNQEEKRRHETARLALERGQPIPGFAESWRSADPRMAQQRSWMGLMIGGLINVALGIGLYFMLSSIPGAYIARYSGAIPGLIGVALLLSALIVALTSRTKSDPGDRPPMS
jgi:hypothetical protein